MKQINIKKCVVTVLGGLLMTGSFVHAQSIQTPDGKMPLVHWAVVESTEGKMPEILSMGAKDVAPTTAKEKGTYALYGGVDKENPNLLRILEIYEDENAYEIHRSSAGFKQYQAERADIVSNIMIFEAVPIVLEQKAAGTGGAVYMNLITVKSDKLESYKALITKEMQRAVKEDEGVLGLFATAEKEHPERIHTMGIYTNPAAYERYISSENYRNFREAVEPMTNTHLSVENLPTKIVLSSKGLN